VHPADVLAELEVAEDDEARQQADDAAHTLAAVRLDLGEALVDPVDRVDAERDDRHDDREADAALLAQRARVRCRCVQVAPLRGFTARLNHARRTASTRAPAASRSRAR